MDPNVEQPQQLVNLQTAQTQVPQTVQKTLPILKILLSVLGGVIILVLIGGLYYLGIRRNNISEKTSTVFPTEPVSVVNIGTTTPTTVPTISNEAAVSWKTYTSSVEKASFQYPQNWTATKPAIQTNYSDADQIGLQSPSGAIKISWVSALSGFGGICSGTAPLGSNSSGSAPCPLIAIIDKTPIKNASNLFVVSGTITKDGQVYQPFLAVQDIGTGELLSTQRSMGYDMYTGRNNGSLPENRGQNTTVLFSTSGAYAGGPSLTSYQATAWFNNPEVQQAKQILLSLTY